MIRNVQDYAYASGQVASGTGTAFLTTPNLEPIDAQVIDSRAAASTALGVGKLFVESFTANNPQDANYIASAVVSQPIPMFSYGVLVEVPVPQLPQAQTGIPNPPGLTTGGGGQIRIRQKGTCLAYCTTGTTAIAPGSFLTADGAGNLTTLAAAPAAGVVLAIAKGSLAASTATPTLVLVSVGGY